MTAADPLYNLLYFTSINASVKYVFRVIEGLDRYRDLDVLRESFKSNEASMAWCCLLSIKLLKSSYGVGIHAEATLKAGFA